MPSENLSPFYAVDLKTKAPNMQVEIRKTDGDFNTEFLADPQPTALFPRTKLELKPETKNIFLWHATPNELGTSDIVYVPHGKYVFTADNEACRNKPIEKALTEVRPEGYLVDFRSLCSQH
jgi:hypothetical protein